MKENFDDKNTMDAVIDKLFLLPTPTNIYKNVPKVSYQINVQYALERTPGYGRNLFAFPEFVLTSVISTKWL